MTLFKRYMKELETGRVSHAWVRGVTKAFNASWRAQRGYSTGATSPKITPQEAQELFDAIATTSPAITPEHAAKGFKWLRSPAVQRKLATRERAIANNEASYFTLAGFLDATMRGYHLPIWRVTDHAGRSFDYYAGSWQSGVPLTVTG